MTELSQAAALPENISSNVPVSIQTSAKEVLAVELPTFDPDAAITNLASLRTEAEDGWKRYIVAGRDAMRAHMQKVYAIYCATMEDEKRGYVLNKLRDALKLREIKVTGATTDEIVFIRTVFDHLSDKSVSMYAASLAEARLHSKVATDDFADWVSRTEGFEKVRELYSSREQGSTAMPKDLVGIALSSIKQTKSTAHLDSIKWRDIDGVEEQFRVLIAVRNKDGTAELKDALLGKESSDRTIKAWEAERKARTEPTKKEKSVADKFAIAQLQVTVANSEMTVAKLEQDLAAARKGGTVEQVESFAAQLENERVSLAAFKESLKKRKKVTTAEA